MCDGFLFNPEIGMHASIGIVDDLVGEDQAARRHGRRDAAHRVDGNHVACTDFLERPDVGAVVDVMRRDGVAVTVACQKNRALATEMTEYKRRRRLAEWRAQHLAPGDFQILEVGESAATDDRYELHVWYA